MRNKKIQTVLIDRELLEVYSPIPLTMDDRKLYPFIIEAQEKIKKDILGKDLFDELIFQIENNIVTELNQALIIKIAPVLAGYTCYFAIPSISMIISEKGITKENSENSTSASLKELNYLRLDVLQRSDSFAEILYSYLIECKDSYPLFHYDSCGCSDNKLLTRYYQIYFPE